MKNDLPYFKVVYSEAEGVQLALQTPSDIIETKKFCQHLNDVIADKTSPQALAAKAYSDSVKAEIQRRKSL